MPTTTPLFNIESYDEGFGSEAQIRGFKVAKRQ
jgi:hypothetical protein